MNTIDVTDEIVANQLEIARQSIEERDKKIGDLLVRVDLLEGVLNRMTQRAGVPVPQLAPKIAPRPAPRRWAVR